MRSRPRAGPQCSPAGPGARREERGEGAGRGDRASRDALPLQKRCRCRASPAARIFLVSQLFCASEASLSIYPEGLFQVLWRSPA